MILIVKMSFHDDTGSVSLCSSMAMIMKAMDTSKSELMPMCCQRTPGRHGYREWV